MGVAMQEAGTGKEVQGIRNWYKDNGDAVKPAIDAAKKA